MLFVPGDVVLHKTDLEIKFYRKYLSLFGLLYMCLNGQKPCTSWMDDFFGDLRYVYTVFYLSIIKLMDLLYFVFQFYLNLRLAAVVSHFFKFNANLVMFTAINIYETILDSTYIIPFKIIKLQY